MRYQTAVVFLATYLCFAPSAQANCRMPEPPELSITEYDESSNSDLIKIDLYREQAVKGLTCLADVMRGIDAGPDRDAARQRLAAELRKFRAFVETANRVVGEHNLSEAESNP